jgi:hypothetical protein
MSDLPSLHAKIDALTASLTAIATTMATRGDLTQMRVEIMERIDRLQDATTIMHTARIVDIGSSERAERLAKAAREDATALGEIVMPLVRLTHAMRTQLDDLSEQVRLLKDGRTP